MTTEKSESESSAPQRELSTAGTAPHEHRAEAGKCYICGTRMGTRAEYDDAAYPERSWIGTEQEANWRQETSRKFHYLMDAAMMVSFFKYGAVADGFPDRVNAIETLELRLQKYKESGNVEHLVDVANFAMIEFMHPANPTAHYKATDADGSPGRIAANTAIYEGKPNQFRNCDLADATENPF